MVKDNRVKRVGHYKDGRRIPSSHMDIIRRQEGAEILYNEDEMLPQIRGSQLDVKNQRNNQLNVAGSHIVTNSQGSQGHNYNGP